MIQSNRLILTLILLSSTLCISLLSCNYAPAITWRILGDPDTSRNALDAKWRLLPSPPSKVKEIVAVDYFTVYVMTNEGKILACYRQSRLDTRCWFTVDHLPTVPPDSPMEGNFAEGPQGITVVQKYQIDYIAGRDSRSAFSYILDSNGEVWQWGFERYGFGAPRVMRITLISSLSGLIGGALLPLIICFLTWRVAKFRTT